jgi:aminoglycoside phosphotransferase (APT) family kinase protein
MPSVKSFGIADGFLGGAEVVREILAAQFPHFGDADVTYLGEGCDSVTFDVNRVWVLRFPKRPDVEQQLLAEMRFLPALAPRLPVRVPVYQLLGQPSRHFPRHFGGYPRLPGVPGILIEPEPDAEYLGQFLSALHAFPLDEAERLGLLDEPGEHVLGEDEIRAEALESFELVRRAAPDAPLARWRAYLDAGVDGGSAGTGPARSLVHNDLAAEHVLCDPATGSIAGVIDWSDAAIGDVAADFAGMFHWGGDALVARILPHYTRPLDDHCLARARFRAACRGVGDVAYGLRSERREYVTAGLRALRSCARL